MAHTILNAPVSVSFQTLPCEYRVVTAQCAAEEDAGLARFIRVHRPQSQSVVLDPWKVRDDFFGLTTMTDLLAFLNATGVFHLHIGGFYDLTIWQDLLGKMLQRNPQRWPELATAYGAGKLMAVRRVSTFYTRFAWSEGRPSCSIHATTTLAALVATIHVDHLRGARFRFCKRPDCGQPYEVTSKHQRLYCSQYCAHFQSLRRLREKKKRERRDHEGTE